MNWKIRKIDGNLHAGSDEKGYIINIIVRNDGRVIGVMSNGYCHWDLEEVKNDVFKKLANKINDLLETNQEKKAVEMWNRFLKFNKLC